MSDASRPDLTDLVAVRSRVSWGAIAAGAMVALIVYMILTLLGVALGVEVAVRGSGEYVGAGAAIYSLVTLLLAMFFGGWATSRLAVGETRTEAVLYGLILWGVLFIGVMWLLTLGLRTGFGAVVGAASGAYANDGGRIDVDRVTDDLKRAGLDQATVEKYRGYYERVRSSPADAGTVGREVAGDLDIRQAGRAARQAAWWSLAGVFVSLASVVLGSLMGSGAVLQPVPILGVRRKGAERRA